MPDIILFKSKQYDTGSSPEATFTPPAGTTWNLQDAGVVVTFIARLPGTPTPKIEATATVTGPWKARYHPLAADVDARGLYDVEWECVRSPTDKITLPTEGFMQWLIGSELNNK